METTATTAAKEPAFAGIPSTACVRIMADSTDFDCRLVAVR
ncbi:MAG TPA: hypothetical protein VMU39_29685 [Solirubrobacteraceae bacterium]|nr:hypothetical protein [Solirubrobacteraceae bacterium]